MRSATDLFSKRELRRKLTSPAVCTSREDSTAGLHAVADLLTADDSIVAAEALKRDIETMPLSAYYCKRTESSANGLVLGFGSVPPRVITESVKRLAAAIEHAAA
jgi:DNA-binding transcriptional MocR family regulator